MALQFSETAPGVHTTAILNPKTEKRHNIAIIESCDAWQLFIDGELAVRDLPSFKAAAAEAEAKFAAPRTSNMVRAAGFLVLLSVAGASAIGMTKVLAPVFTSETAVAAVASDDKSGTSEHRFTRVRSSAAKTASPKLIGPTKPVTPVEEAVVTVSAAPKAATISEADTSKSNEIKPAVGKPAAAVVAAPTPAVNEAPALGLRPIVSTAPTTKEPVEPPVRATGQADLPAPVVINARPTPRSSLGPSQSNRDDSIPETLPSIEPQAVEPANREIAVRVPPLPGKAPVAAAAPLIRSARAPIEPERLSSILAELEVEAREPVTRAGGRPKVERRLVKRPKSKRRSASSRARAVRRSRKKRTLRHAHRARPAYRIAPARQMVCIGHSCRFR